MADKQSIWVEPCNGYFWLLSVSRAGIQLAPLMHLGGGFNNILAGVIGQQTQSGNSTGIDSAGVIRLCGCGPADQNDFADVLTIAKGS